jgi:hypothetical protein
MSYPVATVYYWSGGVDANETIFHQAGTTCHILCEKIYLQLAKIHLIHLLMFGTEWGQSKFALTPFDSMLVKQSIDESVNRNQLTGNRLFVDEIEQ